MKLKIYTEQLTDISRWPCLDLDLPVNQIDKIDVSGIMKFKAGRHGRFY